MSNAYLDDNFERYGDGNEPIVRVNCNALKDPDHEIPTRCYLAYNHSPKKHKAFYIHYHVDEEWE